MSTCMLSDGSSIPTSDEISVSKIKWALQGKINDLNEIKRSEKYTEPPEFKIINNPLSRLEKFLAPVLYWTIVALHAVERLNTMNLPSIVVFTFGWGAIPFFSAAGILLLSFIVFPIIAYIMYGDKYKLRNKFYRKVNSFFEYLISPISVVVSILSFLKKKKEYVEYKGRIDDTLIKAQKFLVDATSENAVEIFRGLTPENVLKIVDKNS